MYVNHSLDHGLPLVNIDARLNTPNEEVIRNLEVNIRRQLPQAYPMGQQDTPIGLIGGGPSLTSTFSKLRHLHEQGLKLVSMNGTHDWLIDRGIRPSAFVMIDAREQNEVFVRNPQKDTKYYISSICNPKVFDNLEGYEVYLFHSINSKDEESDQIKILNEYYWSNWEPTMGGSTVMTRTMVLFNMLGFRYMHVFGFDSCCLGGKHHAYPQSLNDEGPGASIIPIYCGGIWWQCQPWQIAQAKDFQRIVQKIGEAWELKIHGNGLIAHMVGTCADLELDRAPGAPCENEVKDGSSTLESI